MNNVARFAVFAVALIPVHAFSQSPFADAKGNSSLFLDGAGGFAQLTFGEASASIGYRYNVGKRNFWSFDFSGRPSDQTTSLFSGDRLAADARLGLTYGYQFHQSPPGAFEKISDDLANFEAKRAVLTLVTDDEIKKIQGEIDEMKAENKRLTARERDIVEGIEVPQGDSTAVATAIRKRISDNKTKLTILEAEIKVKKDGSAEAKNLDERIKDLKNQLQDLGKNAFVMMGVRLQGRASSFNLYDETKPFADAFSEKSFEGYGASLFINLYRPYATLGLSIGMERSDNLSSLKKVEVIDRQEIPSGDPEDPTIRIIERKRSGFKGAYKKVDLTPIRFDALLRPKQFGSRIGINLMGRMDIDSDDEKLVPGIGVFLLKDGAPSSIVGGVTVLFKDGKGNVALVAGAKF